MQASAIDLGTAVIARAIESIGAVADAISGLDESLRSDHPLQSQTLDGIEGALSSIASAVDTTDFSSVASALNSIADAIKGARGGTPK